MRKTQIVMALIIAIISVGAQAGVKEKKTIRNAQKTADISAETIKKACGNESLRFVLDWKAFDGYNYDRSNFDRYRAMELFGNLTKDISKSVVDLCEDPDYKEEIAKLTEINFAGTQKLEGSYLDISFTLDGTTLKLVLLATRGGMQSKYKKGIKDVF